jgi:chorismate synthase
MLRFLTAGESHGPALVAILEGMPAGVPVDLQALARQMRRRQGGHGRGRRMAIESDAVEVLSGIRVGVTLGSPIALLIRNRDWDNWRFTMSVDAAPSADAGGPHRPPVTRPRPGHADLAGAVKYGHDDLRNVLERASARETAARVAVGALARQLLERLGISVAAHVTAIGPARLEAASPVPFDVIAGAADDSPVRCADAAVARRMVEAIDAARTAGDTLGGTFEVVVRGVPPGLGSHVQWDRRLDGRLAQALVSVPAVKAVEIGCGVQSAFLPGSEVHDEILRGDPAASPLTGLRRTSNHAGGLEGGVSNGEELRVTAYMKPIATLMRPLRSVDLRTGEESAAAIERSDTCAVPAAAVIGEAVVALVVADAFMEKFGGDSLADMERQYTEWRRAVAERFRATTGGSDSSRPPSPAGHDA